MVLLILLALSHERHGQSLVNLELLRSGNHRVPVVDLKSDLVVSVENLLRVSVGSLRAHSERQIGPSIAVLVVPQSDGLMSEVEGAASGTDCASHEAIPEHPIVCGILLGETSSTESTEPDSSKHSPTHQGVVDGVQAVRTTTSLAGRRAICASSLSHAEYVCRSISDLVEGGCDPSVLQLDFDRRVHAVG